MQEDFQKHLEHIKQSKLQTQDIMKDCMPNYKIANSSIEHCWNLIFDQLCNKENTINDLKNASSIIQKLMSSFQKMKKIEIEIKNLALKEKIINFREAQIKAQSGIQENDYKSLDETDLSSIEQKLRLL